MAISIEELAVYSGVSIQEARKNVRALVKLGLVEVRPVKKGQEPKNKKKDT